MSDLSLLGSFPLDRFGEVVVVEESGGFVGARAVSEETVVELYPRIVRTVEEAGFTFVGGDNEGFEAELSFVDARRRTVSVALRAADCPGRLNVRVLLQRSPPT